MRAVKHLLENNFIDIPERFSPAVQDPLPVQGPEGRISSWIVPLASQTELLGWAQFSPTLDFLRYSNVIRDSGTGHYPDFREWFDPATIATRVEITVDNGLQTSRPILTFDRDPSRLVWLVEGIDTAHKGKRWHVAGGNIWEATMPDEVTGGPPGNH